MHDNFHKDLVEGGKAERYVLLHFVKWKYPEAYLTTGNNSDCDIIIPENGKTIEVKFDNLTKKYGNVCIELAEASGKLSGINVTKADYWVQVIEWKPYITYVSLLRQTVFSGKYKHITSKKENKKMCLLPVNDYISISKLMTKRNECNL